MSWNTLSAAQQDTLLRRPFDHYARYRLAADVVDAVGHGRSRVLDLGGGPGSLQTFLPDAHVTSTDLTVPSEWFEQAPSLVVADGAALPFADDAFDVVVTLDTLEHVPPAARSPFLAEVARVSGHWALVVCPFDTPGVADADIALRAYVASHFPPDLPTIAILDEHLGHGHPSLEASRRQLADHGPVATIPSGRLDRWFAGMIAFFHLLSIGDDEPVEVVQRFLNRNFYTADLADPAYRHGLLLRTGEGPDPQDVVAPLLATADEDPLSSGDLSLLTVTLTESLVASTRQAQADAAAARSAKVEAEYRQAAAEEQARRARDDADQLAAARAADAERIAQLSAAHDELVAFRDAVMAHPAMRVRNAVRRMLDR